MEVLLHPVVRYWFAAACVLFLAAIIAVHTSHWGLAAAVAGFGLGLIAGVTRLKHPGVAETAPQAGDSSHLVDVAQFVDALELPAVAFDAQQDVLAINPPAAHLFPNVAAGVPASRVLRHPDLMQLLAQVDGGGPPRSVEIVEHRPQGRRLKASAARLVPPAGASSSIIIVMFRDLTEQDRLAQMRSDFIANASHELRTPLASLKGFIETLQGPAANDSAARLRFLDIMSTQAVRMMRILDDLLSLSRIEMKAHLPPSGLVQLDAIVREVVQGLEPLAEEAGITLDLAVTGEALNVRGDRDELVQVFQNLIQNAIKYGHRGGRVGIAITRDPASGGAAGRLRTIVSDDGPGIAPEHLPRLTERFYRVDNAASREKGGTGLGLAIVKHILNRHRGDLRIASDVGKGSTFTVLLDAPRES